MNNRVSTTILFLVAAAAMPARFESQGTAGRSTRVSIVDGQWHINGQ